MSGFNQSHIQIPLSHDILLTQDSIVGIGIPSSISFTASTFTRSEIKYHPVTKLINHVFANGV
jgi:hypothetical protein